MSNPNAPHPHEPCGAPPSGNHSQRRRSGRFPFKIPADRPRSFYEAMPQGGLAEMFSVAGLPMELRISYCVWLAAGLLGLLGGVIGLFGALVLFAFLPAVAILVLLLVLFGAALSSVQIVLAITLKEGREWARLALTAVAGVSLLLTIISLSFTDGRGGSGFSFLASLTATVLMWSPGSRRWFAAARVRA
ncbi:hypothetical protein [Arthrobacter sp. D1-17]